MRPRFFFDLKNGRELIQDDEGAEADDLKQAIEQTIAEIEESRASGEFDDAGLGWELVVRDASGGEVKRLAI